MAGRSAGSAAATVSPLTAGVDRTDLAVPRAADESALAVLDPLRPLLPDGLRRGSTVAVRGSTSLALAVAAGPAMAGGWIAAIGWHDVGRSQVGLLAAHELGVSWRRLVLVTSPFDRRQWATAMSVLVDAFAVVVVRPTLPISGTDARRLEARARQSGAVMVVSSPVDARTGTIVGANNDKRLRSAWPTPPDVELRVLASTWEGLGHGDGHLQVRRALVEVSGRGRSSRPRRAELWLPTARGEVELVEASPVDPSAEPSEPEIASSLTMEPAAS